MREKTLPRADRFDQWLFDALLATPLHGLSNRARHWMLRKLRGLRLIVSDPIVNFSLGEYNLRLPLSHELPFYRRRLRQYALNLANVSVHVRQKYPDLTMIDVGANIGDSVAIVRRYSDHPILCVEGEPRFFELLRENTRRLPGIELEQTFLGAKGDHVSKICIDCGNAQVVLGSAPGLGNMCTLNEVLSQHPRFARAKLLKLDAEGFDCRIIATETELLSRAKPVLFFEYYPTCCQLTGHHALPVFSQLSGLGYSRILIYQNTGEYFMTLGLDQVHALEDLHRFIADLGGFCDVVAFHNEDLDVSGRVRAAEYANRGNQERELTKVQSREHEG